MSTLLVGLAGGAIGSVLTGAVAFGARLAAIPRELEANEHAVRERDEDLEQWVADEHVRLKRELRDVRNELNSRGLFYSGEHGYQVGLAKERALEAYRDQERQARRDAAEIRDREGWLHMLARSYLRKPPLELTAPGRVAPVLDAWRAPVKRHLSENDQPVPIADPTARTIEETVVDAREHSGDFS